MSEVMTSIREKIERILAGGATNPKNVNSIEFTQIGIQYATDQILDLLVEEAESRKIIWNTDLCDEPHKIRLINSTIDDFIKRVKENK